MFCIFNKRSLKSLKICFYSKTNLGLAFVLFFLTNTLNKNHFNCSIETYYLKSTTGTKRVRFKELKTKKYRIRITQDAPREGCSVGYTSRVCVCLYALVLIMCV